MGTFESICELGSFKECDDKVIPRKKMGKMLEAGRHAPSPGNVQSMEFIVVEDEHKKERLSEIIGDHRIEQSPTLVVLVGDLQRMARRVGEDISHECCNAEAACAAQNMRLTASELGISSFWVTGFNEERIADLFSIPGGKAPLGIVAFGFADEEVSKPTKFGMNELFFYDRYGNQVDSIFDSFEFKGVEETRETLNKKSKGLIQKLRDVL